MQATDLALICVGTPGRGNGQLDTSAVERVGEEIGRALRGRDRYTVVLRSTVLPGTTERRLAPAIARGAERALEGWLGLAVNPEFMREGSSLRDFAQPPITLGGRGRRCGCLRPPRAVRPRSRRRSSRRRSARPRWRSTCPMPSTRSRSPSPTRSATSARRSGGDAQEVMRVFLMDRKLERVGGLPAAGVRLRRLLPAQGRPRALVHAPRTPPTCRCRSCRRSCPPTRPRCGEAWRPCWRLGGVAWGRGARLQPGTDDLRERARW